MRALLALIFFFSTSVFAHPVIYKNGFAFNSSNMPGFANNYVLYSFSNRFAAGAEHWRFTKNGTSNDLGLVKLNTLLWRKNCEDSQANIYLHGGAGVEDRELGNKVTRGTFMGGLEADWETRVLYASAKYLQFQNISMSQTRVGFSPRLAPFEDLQTWFLIQAMTIKDIEDTAVITPMLRFFYHNVLWETGVGTRGDWMLNFMVHY